MKKYIAETIISVILIAMLAVFGSATVYEEQETSELFPDGEVLDGEASVEEALPPMDGMRGEIDVTNGAIILDWSEYARYCDGYILDIYDDENTEEPNRHAEFDSGTTADTFEIPSDITDLKVDLYYFYAGVMSEPLTKMISVNGGVNINIDSPETTNARQVKIEYTAEKAIAAELSVNGIAELVNLTESGFFSAVLDDGINEISIKYEENEIIYIVSGQISVDIVAPVLRLPENKSALKTYEKIYTIAGITEPGCSVSVNSIPVPVNANGVFNQEVKLSAGENSITVSASDLAGNITAQDIVIYLLSDVGSVVEEIPLWQEYLPLIATFTLSLLLFLIIWLIGRGYEKSEKKVLYIIRTVGNTAFILAAASVCAGIYCFVQYIPLRKAVDSEEFYNLMRQNIDDAYSTLVRYEKFIIAVKICAVTAAVSLVLTIASYLIAKKIEKLPFKLEQEDKKEETQEEENTENKEEIIDNVNSIADVTDSAEEKQESGEEHPSPIEQYICPDCGSEFDSSVKFCGKCGAAMNPPSQK